MCFSCEIHGWDTGGQRVGVLVGVSLVMHPCVDIIARTLFALGMGDEAGDGCQLARLSGSLHPRRFLTARRRLSFASVVIACQCYSSSKSTKVAAAHCLRSGRRLAAAHCCSSLKFMVEVCCFSSSTKWSKAAVVARRRTSLWSPLLVVVEVCYCSLSKFVIALELISWLKDFR
ncbi:uncharacterized protein A4U43_C03F19590 [Asparagus officinalis]|uniref:Uncharacterized protein n=1 Tax=Asparagus officinalis TaxID=4686 RepID=A0A5P1FE77_ASPOF|nr:uncharacterized protein A4U43_C03F19590 [Asparagus officinalis]